MHRYQLERPFKLDNNPSVVVKSMIETIQQGSGQNVNMDNWLSLVQFATKKLDLIRVIRC